MTLMKPLSLAFFLSAFFLVACENKRPMMIDLHQSDVTVIKKENCMQNPDTDFWLLNLDSKIGDIGDTIEIDGVVYNNVVKTSALAPELKSAGKRLRIFYHLLGNERTVISRCPATDSLQFAVYNIPIIRYQPL